MVIAQQAAGRVVDDTETPGSWILAEQSARV
jgi:hypothetical protein